ncbi:MAG: glycosyltransferase [Lachnospiraceae bacterium]|nr:glycosyltransferase [Lachnospiraceae bacterium]
MVKRMMAEIRTEIRTGTRIAAITVTYNRTKTLEKCISALMSQSHPVDEIVIVDNHSGEKEQARISEIVARQEAAGKERGTSFHILWLEDNMGGAGGFEAGMKYAMEKLQPDYYWIMDDDAYPREDCLEQLLEGMDALPDAGCVCPLIFGVDLKKYQIFHHKQLTPLILRTRPVSEYPESCTEPVRINANAFVGPLFKREVVEKLGVADGSLFIYGDDTEYTFRVSRKYGVYLLPQAVIDHQDAPTLDANMSAKGWWKEYYGYRNQFFLIREAHQNPIVRGAAYGALTLRILAVIAKGRLRGYHALRGRMLLKAVSDGIHDKRGRTVDPSAYMQYLKEHNIA